MSVRLSRVIVTISVLLVSVSALHVAEAQVGEQAVAAPESKAQAKQSVAGTASVQGRVTRSDSAVPIATVQVRFTMGSSVRKIAITDADGRYTFTELPAGRFSIEFSKAGFVSVQYGQQQPLGEPVRLELKEGQRLQRIDAALRRAGAIEGRVYDENGDPLVEVTVNALQVVVVKGESRLTPVARSALTDDRGEYRLYGLQEGDYYVSARVPTSVSFTADPAGPSARAATEPSGYAPTFHRDGRNIDEAERVSVGSGQDVAGIDIAFRITRLARVSGTLVSFSGKLLDGASVELVRKGPARGVVGVSRIGSDGSFSITGIPPGNYVLNARSIPMSVVAEIARTGRVAPLVSAKESEFASMPITVTGADVTGLMIRTFLPARVRGRLTVDGSSYRPPAKSRIVVTAVPADADALSAGPTAQSVLDNGSFEIGGILGMFVLRVAGLEAPLVVERIARGGVDVTDIGIELQSGEEISDIEVALTSRSTRLMGRVTGIDGRAMSDCTVIVFSSDSERWSLPATRYVREARTGRDGLFHVDGLPPGRYLAVAVGDIDRGRSSDPTYLKSIAKKAASITLRDGESQTLDLRLLAG